MLTLTEQIFAQIDKAQSIAIVFNKNWQGDSIGSALALYSYLQKMDKRATVIADTPATPSPFNFLPGFAGIKNQFDNLRQFIISLDLTNTKVEAMKYQLDDNRLDFIVTPKGGFFNAADISSRGSGFNYDLIFVLGSPDLESLGQIYDSDTEFFYHNPIINIDCHPGNENFGQINLVNLNSVATAETLFNLMLEHNKVLIDADIATNLLTGMISQTKSFKTPNVTPFALSIAAELMDLGARREDIVSQLYGNKTLGVLKLWGAMLSRLQSSLDSKLVWTLIKQTDFSRTQTTADDLISAIDELIVSIPQAQLIAICYEAGAPAEQPTLPTEQPVPPVGQPIPSTEQLAQPANSTNAIIYSVHNLDSLELAKNFQPVGSKKIARLTINETLETAAGKLITDLQEKMSRITI